MNNKEKAVLYFLIISLLIGSIISLYKKQKERRNLLAITMEKSVVEKPEAMTSKAARVPESDKIGFDEINLIDINQASAKELQALPGIGPVLAQRIIEERNRIGKFSSIEDLLRVKGIGKKKLAMLRERVKIGD